MTHSWLSASLLSKIAQRSLQVLYSKARPSTMLSCGDEFFRLASKYLQAKHFRQEHNIR